jgi:guanylate kinase
VVIISGPSGAGKSTVVRNLVGRCRIPLILSVSATTRTPRSGEIDGVDYHFLSRDEFERQRMAGEFLECFEVFGRGHWYGTLRREVTSGLQQGKWVILEIDVQGRRQVVRTLPDALSVFVSPGSFEELERRLRGRKTESEEAIRRRLDVAQQEMAHAAEYDLTVVNDHVESAVEQICQYLERQAPGAG